MKTKIEKNQKTILRRCSVCDKKITIIINRDRTYKNGHYFGEIKIPAGKGKEKEVEYWECPECYKDQKLKKTS
ncbi:MAG: hypothetical protein PHF84_00720 [bacterium]|nr:hypothetical protein [bacterium]